MELRSFLKKGEARRNGSNVTKKISSQKQFVITMNPMWQLAFSPDEGLSCSFLRLLNMV